MEMNSAIGSAEKITLYQANLPPVKWSLASGLRFIDDLDRPGFFEDFRAGLSTLGLICEVAASLVWRPLFYRPIDHENITVMIWIMVIKLLLIQGHRVGTVLTGNNTRRYYRTTASCLPLQKILFEHLLGATSIKCNFFRSPNNVRLCIVWQNYFHRFIHFLVWAVWRVFFFVFSPNLTDFSSDQTNWELKLFDILMTN